MTITIGIGWWILPALVTVIAFFARWSVHRNEPPSYGGYSSIGYDLGRLLSLAVALLLSLAAWLVWALLR